MNDVKWRKFRGEFKNVFKRVFNSVFTTYSMPLSSRLIASAIPLFALLTPPRRRTQLGGVQCWIVMIPDKPWNHLSAFVTRVVLPESKVCSWARLSTAKTRRKFGFSRSPTTLCAYRTQDRTKSHYVKRSKNILSSVSHVISLGHGYSCCCCQSRTSSLHFEVIIESTTETCAYFYSIRVQNSVCWIVEGVTAWCCNPCLKALEHYFWLCCHSPPQSRTYSHVVSLKI